MIFKFFWFLRGLVYKPFFGRFVLPSYIGNPTYIGNFKAIFIGKRVRIFPHARLEVFGKQSSIIIENNVSIGQNLHIVSAGSLIIGENSTLSANVFITNLDHEYNAIGEHILEQPLIVKETIIGKNCFIGYGVVLQAGTVLGKQCIIGSNSVVRGNFSDYSVIVGAPARVIKRYDVKNNIWRKTDDKGNFINEIQ